jgi:hypothetical protein
VGRRPEPVQTLVGSQGSGVSGPSLWIRPCSRLGLSVQIAFAPACGHRRSRVRHGAEEAGSGSRGQRKKWIEAERKSRTLPRDPHLLRHPKAFFRLPAIVVRTVAENDHCHAPSVESTEKALAEERVGAKPCAYPPGQYERWME